MADGQGGASLMDENEAGAPSERLGLAPRPDDSILGGVNRLIASGKEVVSAELDWAKLKGLDVLGHLRRIIFYSTISVVCLIVGLTLLLVTGVVALIPLTGLIGALLIVSAVAFVGTAIFGYVARRLFAAMIEEDKP